MDKSKDTVYRRRPLVMYFLLAFVITWLILAPGVADNLGVLNFEFDGTVLTMISAVGPLSAAIIVTKMTEGSAGVRNIFESMFHWRVKVKWWGVAFLFLAGLFGIAALLSMLIGGAGPDPRQGVFLDGGNLIVVILLLLLGSFGEEPGWRGFALPRLQEKYSPMKATLILTFFWWLWHIPTYWVMPFAMGSAEQFGFVAAFGIQFVVLLILGVLCTWVFNGSGGSVLMPVLLHASWNFWSGGFGQDVSTFLLPFVLLTAIVIGVATKGKLGLNSTGEPGLE